MQTAHTKPLIATISYIGCILLLNLLFVRLPFIHSFGQQFSAADMLVGIIYIVRDFAQREIRHYIIIAMLIGAGLSYFIVTPTIALASCISFIGGELIDWALFSFTRKPLGERLLLSSLISTPCDSLIFLMISQRLAWLPFIIMSIGKVTGVFLLWGYWFWRQRTIS